MKALAADDPRVIGEYRLRGRIGSGGMGRVYLGLSPAGRAVAIKVVQPNLAEDTEFLRRFRQEVALAKAVSGIYTAPVVASGLEEDPPWLATAFVPGPSLAQVVSDHGPLSEASLWPLLGGLVEALAAIHACGVMHRDLKPSNVLLATDGPRVIDFGISRAADGVSLTATGVVFGTPGYVSPEQAEGKPSGPASDMFALGCVIAYAARGVGPFGLGTAASILYRVVHAAPDLDPIPAGPGTPAVPGVPGRLREVLAACLAKDPAARPTPRSLSGVIAEGIQGCGVPSVAFWPRAMTGVIAAYQAELEQETQGSDQSGFSWATLVHPPTTPPAQTPAASPGSARASGSDWSPQPTAASPGSARASGSGWSPQPPTPQAPPPAWPYAPPGMTGAANAPSSQLEPAAPPQGVSGSHGVAGWQGGAGVRGSGAGSAGVPGTQSAAGSAGGAGGHGTREPQEGPGSQGAPNPPGNSNTFNYPQPQGYAGAQASQASPRGYLSGDTPTPVQTPPYPQYPVTPGSPGSSGLSRPAPASVLNAVRLMYAGAAYAFLYALGVIVATAAIVKNHPLFVTSKTGASRVTVGDVAFFAVIEAIIVIALWLWLARACRRGNNWARITGTVLFGIHTLGMLGVIASPHRDLGLIKVLTVVGWLIAGAAVVYLWRRESSGYFSGRTGPGGPTAAQG
ncbi:MAG: protein kinase domain-containing protein [Streptosporangiaceae bacterium]